MSTGKEYPIVERWEKDYEAAIFGSFPRHRHLTVRQLIEELSRAEGQLAEMLHISPHDLAVFAAKWPVTQTELERLERENALLKAPITNKEYDQWRHRMSALQDRDDADLNCRKASKCAFDELINARVYVGFIHIHILQCPTCGSNRRDIRGTIRTEYLTRECADGWHKERPL